MLEKIKERQDIVITLTGTHGECDLEEEKDDFASLFLALSDDYDLEDTDEYVSIKNILVHLDSGITVKVKEENYNDLQA